MEIIPILGLLANSTDYFVFLHDEHDESNMSYIGKLAMWYLATLFGVIFSFFL